MKLYAFKFLQAREDAQKSVTSRGFSAALENRHGAKLPQDFFLTASRAGIPQNDSPPLTGSMTKMFAEVCALGATTTKSGTEMTTHLQTSAPQLSYEEFKKAVLDPTTMAAHFSQVSAPKTVTHPTQDTVRFDHTMTIALPLGASTSISNIVNVSVANENGVFKAVVKSEGVDTRGIGGVKESCFTLYPDGTLALDITVTMGIAAQIPLISDAAESILESNLSVYVEDMKAYLEFIKGHSR